MLGSVRVMRQRPSTVVAAFASAWVLSCDRPAAAPPAPPAPPERRAILEKVSGDIKIKRSDSDEWLAATPGVTLSREDKLRSSKGASATVRFDEGTELAIDEETLVSISDLPAGSPGKGTVTLLRGKVDAEVDRRHSTEFSVKTPAAVARASKEIVFQ